MSLGDNTIHYDTRLNHVEQDLAGLRGIVETNQRATIDRIDRLTNAVEGIKEYDQSSGWDTKDVLSLVGKTFLGLAAVIVSLMYGGAQYINSEIDNGTAEIHNLQRKIEHFDELAHKRDDIIMGLVAQASASEVSRKAIGDYAKETREALGK